VVTGDAANESSLEVESVKLSGNRPPHSDYLLDEDPLTENSSYELEPSEPRIAVCDTSAVNSVKLRIRTWPSRWRGHTLGLAVEQVAVGRHPGCHSNA